MFKDLRYSINVNDVPFELIVFENKRPYESVQVIVKREDFIDTGYSEAFTSKDAAIAAGFSYIAAIFSTVVGKNFDI